MSVDDYVVKGVLGSGSFGKVSQIVRKSDNKMLVWKEIHYGSMTEKEKQLLVSEVNIIKDLKSSFIVRYYDRIIDREKKRIFIIMEHCPRGDLAGFIRNLKRSKEFLKEDQVWRILSQLVMALKDCHVRRGSPKIIHRDIKPGNNKNHDIKLGDFGLARILSENTHLARTHVGTPFYMSPEQITESGYDEKSDIWSLGCVLYELCQLSPPFEATNHLSLANKIMAGNFAPISPKYSSELSNLITSMLNVDPRKRPTIEEISNQPTLNSLIQTQILQLRYQQVKKREEEAKRILEEVKQREKLLDERERAIELREKELRKLEIMYNVHRSETPRKGAPSENKENMTPSGNIYKNFKYN